MDEHKLTRVAIFLMLSLTVVACTRERRIPREETPPTPVQVEVIPIATTVPVQPTAAFESIPSPAATAVPVVPSPLPGIESPAPTQSPEISGDLAEIEEILSDLDQILGSTDIDVNIP